ncbi:SWIM zinc finger family protein [Halovenus marina]|uniref:SWIM zinc finger family protein n=1 Tax=Halovenus marina TaxID=3396621 RepID=UPI003F5603B7
MSSESVQPDIEPRTIRALREHMTVIEEARALFSVTTQSGSEYTVDIQGEPACTCPDFQHREEVKECKHICRVRLECSQVDTDALEARLSETADDLDANAADLEEQAQELAETADDLRDAVDRLEEVTGDA